MADYAITVADVKSGFDTAASDAEITALIAVADLAEAVPFGDVESEPVGIRVQTRGLSYGDDARQSGMNRARRRERATGAVCSRAERVALTV